MARAHQPRERCQRKKLMVFLGSAGEVTVDLFWLLQLMHSHLVMIREADSQPLMVL